MKSCEINIRGIPLILSGLRSVPSRAFSLVFKMDTAISLLRHCDVGAFRVM